MKVVFKNLEQFVQVDGTDDAKDYLETIEAMATMGLDESEQSEVLQLVAGILHLGNVLFAEVGSETAAVHLDESKF